MTSAWLATAYRKQGYALASNRLSKALMRELQAETQQLIRELRPGHPYWERVVVPLSRLKQSRNPGIDPEILEEEPFIISELPLLSRVLFGALLQPELWQSASELLESDELVYHFSNLTRKPARIGPNISWHRDFPNRYICPASSRNFLRALIPLQVMSELNGAIEIIPGSHRQAAESGSEALTLTMAPGDILFLHPDLLHGGKENRSDQERTLLIVQIGRQKTDFLAYTPEFLTGSGLEELRHAYDLHP